MPYIDIGRDRIYAEIHGDGEDLLLVSGVGGSTKFWDAQIKPLSKHYRLILHDPRGCGRSTKSGAVLGAQEMAADLVRIMDALKIESAHLLGHSTGGGVGQHIALDHPERLDKLILSCSWCGPDPYLKQLFKTRRHILDACGPEAYFFIGAATAMPGWYLQSRFTSPKEFFESRLKDFQGIDIERDRLDAVIAHDLRDSVHRITAPTLVLGAEDDQVTPAGLARELATRIPGAKLRMLANGGHYCPTTVPEQYGEPILEFLNAKRKPINRPLMAESVG